MQVKESQQCKCSHCRDQIDHADRLHHQHMNVLMNQLSAEQRRLYAAIESTRMGRGGCRLLSEITGLAGVTIARGRRDLAAHLEGRPLEHATGRTGRKSIEAKYPDIKHVLEQLVEDDTAGDPMTRKKWVRPSSRKLSKALAQMGYTVNYHSLCRLLREMGYSMKVNVRKRASTAYAPKRDTQFSYVAS